jgi:hypothetical protein
LFKSNEHVTVEGCVESDCQKVGNQLLLSRDKPGAVNHMLLRVFERASHSNLPVRNAKHNSHEAHQEQKQPAEKRFRALFHKTHEIWSPGN